MASTGRVTMFGVLRAFFGLLLTFLLPGFALTRAMFPRKKTFHPDYDIIYQLAIGITLSLIIVIILGVSVQGMGVNPATGRGYFTTGYILFSLLTITGVFFLIGWWRGAYPRLGWVNPKLRRIPSSPAVTRLVKDRKRIMALHDLVSERETILKEIRFCETRSGAQGPEMRHHYADKLKVLFKRLEVINAEIDHIEGGAFEQYAKMKLEDVLEEEVEEEEEGDKLEGKEDGA